MNDSCGVFWAPQRSSFITDGRSTRGVAISSRRAWLKAIDVDTEKPPAETAIPLAQRFPTAHQYLRMRLFDEIFPIPPAITCVAEALGDDRWRVSVRWPVIEIEAQAEFSGDDLRRIYGPWSAWARGIV